MKRSTYLRRLARTLGNEADRVDANKKGRAWIVLNEAVGILMSLADEADAPKLP